MTATGTNPAEEEARRVKVGRLIDMLDEARDGQGYTAAEIAAFTEGQWDLLADAYCDRHHITQRGISDETRSRVLDVVAWREARRAAEADEDDPFRGLV